MEFIDIGLNLMHKSFNKDREELISNGKKVGVSKAIITGSSLTSSIEAANYASKYPETLYSTCGVHPHNAKTCDKSTISQLEELAKMDCVVAIGECGLDYNRNFSPQNIQRKWFREQLKLAQDLDMPVFLHDRESYADFSKILREFPDIGERSVVHCFTGDKYELEDYLSLGCYIGITGWVCDERRGDKLREAIKLLAPEKLMIETDAPFLIPRDLKPKPKKHRNEPKYLPHILNRIASEMGLDSKQLAKQVYKNTKEFFKI